MAWQRKSKQKGKRVIRRTLADGTVKTYEYAKYKPKPRVVSDTIQGLIDAYLSSPEFAALSASSKEHRIPYLRPLAKLGDVPLASVRRRDIIALHDGMKAIGNGSANGFLAAAKALFSWAIQKEWLEHSPTIGVKAAKGGHLRAWTREEADAAERGLPEHLRRVIVLGRHTGQRRGDLCAMLWSSYDGNSIRLTQLKTKPGAVPVKLVIPVGPVLRAELDAWKATASTVTILSNARNRPFNVKTLSHSLPYALERIGLSPELGVHGLRKLCAAELAEAGCSIHEISSITGHRTLGMVELYTRSADQTRLAGAAIVRLEAHRKGG